MSVTNLTNHVGHRVIRAVSVPLRFVLPIVIGVAPYLAYFLLFLGGPAMRTGGQIPSGYMQIDGEGWTMTVPASWESAPVFRPDSPFTVVDLFASSQAAPTAIPERPEYRARN